MQGRCHAHFSWGNFTALLFCWAELDDSKRRFWSLTTQTVIHFAWIALSQWESTWGTAERCWPLFMVGCLHLTPSPSFGIQDWIRMTVTDNYWGWVRGWEGFTSLLTFTRRKVEGGAYFKEFKEFSFKFEQIGMSADKAQQIRSKSCSNSCLNVSRFVRVWIPIHRHRPRFAKDSPNEDSPRVNFCWVWLMMRPLSNIGRV